MSGLIKNELLKIRAQISFKVILIIALVIAVMAPLFTLLLSSIESMTFYDSRERYVDGSKEEGIWGEYCRARLNVFDQIDELGIKENSWEYNLYFQDFMESAMALKGLELIKSGKYSYDEVTSYFYETYRYMGDYYYYVDDPSIKTETQSETGEEPKENNDKKELSEKVEAAYLNAKTNYDEAFNSIKFFSLDEFYQSKIDSYQTEMISLRDHLESIKNAPAGEKEIEKALREYDVKSTELSLETTPLMIKAIEYLKKEQIDNYSDWRVIAQMNTRSSIYQGLKSCIPYDKVVFDENESYKLEYATYDNYVDNMNEQKNFYETALALLDNSIENNIPIDINGNSGKSLMQSSMNTQIMIFSLFMIIAAAMSIAKEHADGTIRLLLARPKSRSKILWSKYISILIVGFFNYLICFVYSVLVFTIYDASSIWGMSNHILFGSVITLPTILLLLLQYIMLSIGSLLLMSLAFMFSVITKKSGLALLFPMLIIAITNTISTACSVLIIMTSNMGIIRFIKYSILSYFDLTKHIPTPLDTIARSENIFNLLNISTPQLYPVWFGIIQLVLLIAVFVFISFKVFKKQDIKG